MKANLVIRALALVIVVLMMGILEVGSALATPFNYGEGVTPLEWPVGTRSNPTVIKISIEHDSNQPPDRSALLKEGMERWNAELQNRGIKLEISVRASGEAAPAGSVNCHYGSAGDSMDMDQGDPNAPKLNGNAGLAGCGGANGVITNAEILIKSNLSAQGPEEKEYIRNLGAHEITHILGLADDDNGSVTDHDQGNDAVTFNDHDRSEIGTLYPVLDANNNKKDAKAKATTTRETTGDGKNQYNYTFTYDTDDGEVELGHVTLITLGIYPDLIDDIITPPGWEVFNPADPAHLDPAYPYYQGYMEDGHPIPAPWDPDGKPAVAFRISTGEPLNYANGFEGYAVTFSIIAKNDVPGHIEVWAGGPVQLLEGPRQNQPHIVGGTVVQEDIFEVMMSWLGLVGFTVLATGLWVLLRQRKVQ